MSSSDNNHAPTGFALTFEDNFDEVGQQPNSDNWLYDLGHGDHSGGPGWGQPVLVQFKPPRDSNLHFLIQLPEHAQGPHNMCHPQTHASRTFLIRPPRQICLQNQNVILAHKYEHVWLPVFNRQRLESRTTHIGHIAWFNGMLRVGRKRIGRSDGQEHVQVHAFPWSRLQN